MGKLIDFRFSAVSPETLSKSGRYIGKYSYWKLYAIENIFRIIIHSILTLEIPKGWWDTAVDGTIRRKAERFKNSYGKKSWHGTPGTHEVYYIDLKDLNEIIRANANLFIPVIPDIDKWMVGIEDIRLPRNVVAHMNFPSQADIKRIDVFHNDCLGLLASVQARIPLLIP